MKITPIISAILFLLILFIGSSNNKAVAKFVKITHPWIPAPSFDLMRPSGPRVEGSGLGVTTGDPDFVQYQVLFVVNVKETTLTERGVLFSSFVDLFLAAQKIILIKNPQYSYITISEKNLQLIQTDGLGTPSNVCGASILIADFVDSKNTVKNPRSDEFKREFIKDIISAIMKVLPDFNLKNKYDYIEAAFNSIGFIGPDGIGKPSDSIDEVYSHTGAAVNIQDATGIRVAVLDTGINFGKRKIPVTGTMVTAGANLISLKDPAWATYYANFTNPGSISNNTSDDFAFSKGLLQINGHGTGVAGIISSVESSDTVNLDNNFSVVRNADIIPVKVCDAKGNCSDVSIILGLCYAASVKADVINLSLGSLLNSPIILSTIRDVINSGSVVIAAAGNSREEPDPMHPRKPGPLVGPNLYCTPNLKKQDPLHPEHWRYNCPVYPAAFSDARINDGLISVGSTGIKFNLAPPPVHDYLSYPYSSFSTYSLETIDIVAPGENILAYSTTSNSKILLLEDNHNGTSYAAPHISGAAAALIAAHQKLGSALKLKPEEVEKRLKLTARQRIYDFPDKPTKSYTLCVEDPVSKLNSSAFCMVNIPNAIQNP
jgi:subtilisin family serine protease